MPALTYLPGDWGRFAQVLAQGGGDVGGPAGVPTFGGAGGGGGSGFANPLDFGISGQLRQQQIGPASAPHRGSELEIEMRRIAAENARAASYAQAHEQALAGMPRPKFDRRGRAVIDEDYIASRKDEQARALAAREEADKRVRARQDKQDKLDDIRLAREQDAEKLKQHRIDTADEVADRQMRAVRARALGDEQAAAMIEIGIQQIQNGADPANVPVGPAPVDNRDPQNPRAMRDVAAEIRAWRAQAVDEASKGGDPAQMFALADEAEALFMSGGLTRESFSDMRNRYAGIVKDRAKQTEESARSAISAQIKANLAALQDEDLPPEMRSALAARVLADRDKLPPSMWGESDPLFAVPFGNQGPRGEDAARLRAEKAQANAVLADRNASPEEKGIANVFLEQADEWNKSGRIPEGFGWFSETRPTIDVTDTGSRAGREFSETVGVALSGGFNPQTREFVPGIASNIRRIDETDGKPAPINVEQEVARLQPAIDSIYRMAMDNGATTDEALASVHQMVEKHLDAQPEFQTAGKVIEELSDYYKPDEAAVVSAARDYNPGDPFKKAEVLKAASIVSKGASRSSREEYENARNTLYAAWFDSRRDSVGARLDKLASKLYGAGDMQPYAAEERSGLERVVGLLSLGGAEADEAELKRNVLEQYMNTAAAMLQVKLGLLQRSITQAGGGAVPAGDRGGAPVAAGGALGGGG